MKKNNPIKYLGAILLLSSLGALVFLISIPEVLAKETYSNQEILQWKYNQKKKEVDIKYNTQKKVETKKIIIPKKTIEKKVKLPIVPKKVTPKKEPTQITNIPTLPVIIDNKSEPTKKEYVSPTVTSVGTQSFSLSNPHTKRYLVTYKKNETPKTTSSIHRLKKRLPLKSLNVEVIEATDTEINSLKQEGLNIIPDVAMESSSISEYDLSWGVRKIGAEKLHDLGIKGPAVKVAIIDSGIDYTHPEIAPYYKGGVDFTVAPFGTNPMDTWGHGTSVAGIVGSALNDSNGVGVAPEVELYALKAGDGGTVYASGAAYAMNWAIENGMNITNSSFGSKSPAVKGWLELIYQRAKDAGILNIAGVGNTGTCDGYIDPEPFYPASLPSTIAVGAVNELNGRACFSRVSNDVDLVAPGTNIYTTYLNHENGRFDGTSFATPHVVGAAALLWNLVPDVNHNGRKNDEIENLLLSTATDFGPVGRDAFYGAGVVNVLNAYNNIPEETIDPNLLMTTYLDRNTLKQGVDTETNLTVILTNELNKPVGEIGSAITVSNLISSTTILWSENSAGNYLTTLSISSLNVGQNNLTVTATDSRGKTANQNITITVIEKDPLPEAILNTTLSINKNTFKKESDTEALLTLLATDENNTPVTGLSGNISVISPSTIPNTITWTENTPGTYKATIPLENLSVKTHTVSLRMADTRGKISTGTASFTLLARDPLPDPEKTLQVTLNSKKPIYTLYTRGKKGDQFITLRIIVKDESGKLINKIPKNNFIVKLTETSTALEINRITEIKRGNYDIKIAKDSLPIAQGESIHEISVEVKDAREISAGTITQFSTIYTPSSLKIVSVDYMKDPSSGLGIPVVNGKFVMKNKELAFVSQAIPKDGSVVIPVVVVKDEFDNPIEGAKVTLRIMDGKKVLGTKVATSGSDGKASIEFILKKSGCFSTNVIKITKKGYAFTKGTPSNTSCNGELN